MAKMKTPMSEPRIEPGSKKNILIGAINARLGVSNP